MIGLARIKLIPNNLHDFDDYADESPNANDLKHWPKVL